ncbi:thioredoxin fold domain-containing protein [Massilia sp. NR 4-1]|uniref:thioredoxin fold domain-containing protein n=1 Tax=Massilia sp. NR 4-1 TaxID=1678028 RepID=UPI00067AC24E|nr:thioredoxin fold domain-containing protein [Massilia sp. NR 4-1]AKU21220.1 hypothetical protein ACZ75_06730 [Massilia sp. NR 4-1]
METKDRIELFGDSLLIQFAVTGLTSNVSLIDVLKGATFSREGASISVCTQNLLVESKVETFPNEALATSALAGICTAMRRYARARRLQYVCRSTVLWLGLPVLLLMLMAILNLAVSRAQAETQQHPAVQAPTSHDIAESANGALSHPNPAELAQAMADGARTGNFSIKLSSGSKGALYIFADPTCGACRRLEREYAALAKDYTIHIFPVSVIGGDVSRSRLKRLFCADAGKRMAYWKTLASGRDIDALDCAQGAAAVDGNNQVFNAMHLEYTPTIITARGNLIPETLPNTAAAIRQWVSLHDTAPAR